MDNELQIKVPKDIAKRDRDTANVAAAARPMPFLKANYFVGRYMQLYFHGRKPNPADFKLTLEEANSLDRRLTEILTKPELHQDGEIESIAERIKVVE